MSCKAEPSAPVLGGNAELWDFGPAVDEPPRGGDTRLERGPAEPPHPARPVRVRAARFRS